VSSGSGDNKLAARSQSSEQRRHGFAICRCREDQPGAAQRLKCGNRLLNLGVNVMMRPEFLRETFLFRSASNGRDSKTHASRKLNSEVAKPTHSLNSDELAGSGLRISQRIEGRQSGAEEWRRFRWQKIIRNGRESARLADHHFGITAIAVNTRNGLILAINEVATATVFAMPALATHKTHAHPLSFFPALHTGSYGFDLSDHFMAGHARENESGKTAFNRKSVRVADATGLDT